MAKVKMVDSRTTYKSIFSIGVNEYFTDGGELCCKVSNFTDNNVFSVKKGKVITVDRHSNVLPVSEFEITIKG